MTTFSLTEDSNGKSLAIFFDNGDTETIPESHKNFKQILDLWLSGEANDDNVQPLVAIFQTIARKLVNISERVSLEGRNVLFDGDILRGELADVITDMAEAGDDFKPLVNFLEKAKTNPSLTSVDDLYRWISNGQLVIHPDGDIIAYKGVSVDASGISRSISSGTAFVNNIEHRGNIPNVPGTTISMPRSYVDSDASVGCSVGLHAGTYDYASGFAQGRLILVKINPRDVVSVPSDCSSQKLRVSRYVVLSEIEQKIESRVFDDVEEDDEDEYEYGDYEDYDDGEDWEPEEEEPIRDEKGRFIKGGKRDEKGRFIKG